MVDTPMALGVQLRPTDGEPLKDPTRYLYLVGSLIYLGITRSDISHLVHILGQFVSAPTQLHYSHLLRVLRIFEGLSLVTFSFLASILSSFRFTLMRPELAIILIASLFLPIVFSLVPL